MLANPDEFLSQTRSAVVHLFDGLAIYKEMLHSFSRTGFISGEPDLVKRAKDFDRWWNENADAIERDRELQRQYFAESFAMNVLAGSILTIACKGIEIFSVPQETPEGWDPKLFLRKDGSPTAASPFAVGRLFRQVPFGLIIYAARNQYAHFNEPSLNEINHAIFKQFATVPDRDYRDPALDLSTCPPTIVAHNVVSCIKWTGIEAYERDMHDVFATVDRSNVDGVSGQAG